MSGVIAAALIVGLAVGLPLGMLVIGFAESGLTRIAFWFCATATQIANIIVVAIAVKLIS